MDPIDTPANRRKVWIRSLKTLAAAIVIYFVVLPLVPGFRRAWDDLADVEAPMLLIGVSLQFAALLCYSLLTRAALGPDGEHLNPLSRESRVPTQALPWPRRASGRP